MPPSKHESRCHVNSLQQELALKVLCSQWMWVNFFSFLPVSLALCRWSIIAELIVRSGVG